MTTSVDGLVSGLSTSSLISQLMSVEKAPQDRLKTKVSSAEKALNAYQSVNSKLSALKSAAEDLGKLNVWRGVKPAASSTAVTVAPTGDLNSASGSLTFDVKRLARPQTTTLRVNIAKTVDTDNNGTMDRAADLAGSIKIAPVTYAEDGTVLATGTPVDVALGTDKSPAAIAAAINSANLGVKAFVAKISDTEGILQLTGSKPGADKGFQIIGLDNAGVGGTSPSTDPNAYSQDAMLQVGDPNTTGYQVRSSNNVFKDLMPGVTITATKMEDGITVSSSADTAGIAAKFQAMIDAANATLTEIGSQTAYDPATKKGSTLTGDFMVRQMSQTIMSAVSVGLTYKKKDVNNVEQKIEFGSLKQFGIELQRDGKLKFDAEKFTTAYNTDPSRIQEAGIELGDQFRALASKQSGSVTSVVLGRKNEIDSINDQISDWDVRLSARQDALQRKYAALETSLGSLKNQSSWLSGQLSGI